MDDEIIYHRNRLSAVEYDESYNYIDVSTSSGDTNHSIKSEASAGYKLYQQACHVEPTESVPEQNAESNIYLRQEPQSENGCFIKDSMYECYESLRVNQQ